MRRDDFISTAELVALGKMDPISKRSDNTQIILMYERLSAGRKMIEHVFDQLLDRTIEDAGLNLKIASSLKELDKIQSSLHNAVSSIVKSNDETKNYHDQIVKAQYQTRDLLVILEKEMSDFKEQCDAKLPDESDMNSKLEELSNGLKRTIANNRQLYSIYTELMDYLRTEKSQIYKLEQSVDNLTVINDAIRKTTENHREQTKQLSKLSSDLGSLSQDPFYMMDNALFRNKLLSAVVCHKEWMKTMRKMIDTKGQVLEQMNEHLCGFGISYDSMHPKNAVVTEDWTRLGELHSSLHKMAESAYDAMMSGEKEKSKMMFLDMKDISDEILSCCDSLQKAVKALDKKKESVYLTSDNRN